MSVFRDLARSAIEAVSVNSRLQFSWLGTPSPPLSRELATAIDGDSARKYLLHQLTQRLYQSFFCCGGVRGADAEEHGAVPDVRKNPVFASRLSNANSGRGSWRNGWRIRSVIGDDLTVEREGLILRVSRGGYRRDSDGEIVPGQPVEVRFPKEQLGISPGFYMAHSNEEFICSNPEDVLRIYWNVRGVASVCLMAQLTERLNRRQLPFEFKVMHDSVDPHRCDRAVLYVRRDSFDELADDLAATYSRVADSIRPEVPAFAKSLAPGLGLAENPQVGGSFGKHRCGLLADGILRAYELQRSKPLAAVDESFEANGIDLDAPYVNPNSPDRYSFPRIPPRPAARPQSTVQEPPAFARRPYEPLQDTALELALRLARDAFWHEDRCTWLAPELGAPNASQQSSATLNATLYRGNSGLALFLSESHHRSDEALLRRTALGAMWQALRQGRSECTASELGLYSGSLGIALCAARVGSRLGDNKLVAAAASLVREVHRRDPGREFDVVGGTSGGILALLAIGELTEDPFCFDFAAELGRTLQSNAESSDAGVSWRSPRETSSRNLTGYSHGTAGAAHALLELFAVTGEQSFVETALRAFDYERHWFDSTVSNWPDFRRREGDPLARSSTSVANRFVTTWCHGAPGIALSRLRAFELLQDETLKDEAVLALETTRSSLRRWLTDDSSNLCLCHGLLGNAEVLREGAEVLSDDGTTDRDLIHDVAGVSASRISTDRRPLDEQIAERGMGFMAGLAGIGYSFLRFTDTEMPSLLAVRPESFSVRDSTDRAKNASVAMSIERSIGHGV